MSPVRDPGDRHLRRFQRDLAEKARRTQPGPTAPSRNAGPARKPDDQSDSETGWDDDELEEMPQRARRGTRRAESARRLAAARAIDAPTDAGEQPGDRDLLPGVAIVVALARGPCEVELSDGSVVAAHLPKVLARTYQGTLAVGDEVRLERRSAGELAIALVLPRRTRLSRPDPLNRRRERVLAANLDLAVVVASVLRPALSTGLIDRFLVALGHGGVPAALVVNKVDLFAEAGERERLLEALAPYRRLDLPVHLVSTRTGEGIAPLRARLLGRSVAFVGHSGVGKSSLLNALAPEAAARVGATAAGSGRGRHTTSQARIYRLDAATRIIDTPGIREFGLWEMSPREVSAYFDEFESLTGGCRFSDCTHRDEPACAVREAAGSAALSAERYATYRRIVDSLDRV